MDEQNLQQAVKKNRLWIFVSIGSLLAVIILSYMLISAPDRTGQINALEQDKAKLEGQIIEIKNNNAMLEASNKKLESEKIALVDSMATTHKKIDKLNNDLKKTVTHINGYDGAELVDFFTDHFNGK